MPSFTSMRRVHHSAGQMFDLVADIESYPKFLPLCVGARILRRSPGREEGTEIVVADMQVGYKAIRETFTSRVVLDRSHNLIEVDYIDGPFRRMHNRWRFEDETESLASRVKFFIDYEFRSRAFAALMGVMFDSAFRRFAQAFEERADRIYASGAVGALASRS